ncbi:MAG: rod shape-determining protein MreD [Bacteroidales bacterium]|nr:rod shape-determining protein MreD [Bacteroidales bacterium]
MDFKIIKHTGRFLIMIGIQLLILNQIHFSGFITPYLYPLFILLLPFNIKGYTLLLTAFFTGLVIDIFSDSPGMHASATLIMAFLRPAVISLITVKTEFDQDIEPRFDFMGAGWVFIYTLILIFIHHLSLFTLEIFRFADYGETMLQTILSTAFSVGLIMLAHILMGTQKKTKT